MVISHSPCRLTTGAEPRWHTPHMPDNLSSTVPDRTTDFKRPKASRSGRPLTAESCKTHPATDHTFFLTASRANSRSYGEPRGDSPIHQMWLLVKNRKLLRA